jgi:hypothetical protein
MLSYWLSWGLANFFFAWAGLKLQSSQVARTIGVSHCNLASQKVFFFFLGEEGYVDKKLLAVADIFAYLLGSGGITNQL